MRLWPILKDPLQMVALDIGGHISQGSLTDSTQRRGLSFTDGFLLHTEPGERPPDIITGGEGAMHLLPT